MIINQIQRFGQLAFIQTIFGVAALASLTYICFQFDVNSTTVALLYLIAIVPVSLVRSIVPSILVSIIAYLLLDTFFTPPLFHPAMNDPLDIVAPIAYLSTSFVIHRLMTRMRRSIENEKLAEENLRKSQAELAHVSRTMTMGEMATSIAHEINQPLSAIVTNGSACLNWLAGESPNLAEAREAAQRIVRDGSRAGEIIARIRTFLEKTDTQKVKLDANRVILEVVALSRNEAKSVGISIQTKLDDNLPPVLGDRIQLQQVLLNLIINGIEAMTESKNGSRELIVRSGVQDSDFVVISVEDRGLGIEPESLDMIFEAFYTTKPKGMGMGLAISRSIVEDHGGQLWAALNDAGGSNFHFTILKYI